MAHYARINEDDVVVEVVAVNSVSVDEDNEQEVNVYLAECGMPGEWLRCSYNTVKGVHTLGGTPFRGTYPGQGMYYDRELDLFMAFRKPTPDAVFDLDSYSWTIPGEDEATQATA